MDQVDDIWSGCQIFESMIIEAMARYLYVYLGLEPGGTSRERLLPSSLRHGHDIGELNALRIDLLDTQYWQAFYEIQPVTAWSLSSHDLRDECC